MFQWIVTIIKILITNIFNLITFKNTSKTLGILNPIKKLDDETIELDFSKIKKINIKNLKMIEFEDNIVMKTNKHFVLDSNAFKSNSKFKVIVNPEEEVTKEFNPEIYIEHLILKEKEKLNNRLKELNKTSSSIELDEFNKPFLVSNPPSIKKVKIDNLKKVVTRREV